MYRKCKLYRFDNDSGEWKERGVGQVRLLQSQDNGKIRLLMRQEKTLKIRANHFGEGQLFLRRPIMLGINVCSDHTRCRHKH